MATIPSEFSDTVNGNFRGIVKVVNDDGAEATEQKLQHGVAADVTGSAGDQNGLGHQRRFGVTQRIRKRIRRRR